MTIEITGIMTMTIMTMASDYGNHAYDNSDYVNYVYDKWLCES